MRIEKLNEDKIRIFFNIDDLMEKNIDLHTFMSDSMETQDLFLDMLEKAESELGFKTKDYKLVIEALASSDGNFIITVTRMSPNDTFSVSKKNKKTVKAKIKSFSPNNVSSINVFNHFDDFCSFCSNINNISNLPASHFKTASLFHYDDKYYLILNNSKLGKEVVKTIFSMISEFATPIKNEVLFERKLREYGKVIFKKNAIHDCLKYFC